MAVIHNSSSAGHNQKPNTIEVSDWGGCSSIGRTRAENQDAWGEAHGQRFVVADGMGGTEGGGVASGLAVGGFLTADATSKSQWLKAIKRLDRSVQRQCKTQGFRMAGSTLVGLVITTDHCLIVSVGDSRVYLARGERVGLLTCDHNLRNLRIEEGLPPDSPDQRGRPDALTAFVGSGNPTQRIDVSLLPTQPGDRILLCSDGVHGQVSNAKLSHLLTTAGDPTDTATALVSAADTAGGIDNSTALVVELGRKRT